MIELIRVRPNYFDQSPPGYSTGETRKYKHAYETSDGRWLIERAYGMCGGGWRVTDTHGEYVCSSCSTSDGHTTIEPTLAAAGAFVSEWNCWSCAG